MQIQELIKKSEEQKELDKYPLQFDGEPQKDYILKRENNLWVVENLLTGHKKTLMFGDKLEFYNYTESHKKTGQWIGTCMGEVTSWNSACVNVGYREKMFNYIMGPDTKFYNFYPVKMDIENIQNSSMKIVYILLSIVVIYTCINLYFWLGN